MTCGKVGAKPSSVIRNASIRGPPYYKASNDEGM
jgi:hypothetical protein